MNGLGMITTTAITKPTVTSVLVYYFHNTFSRANENEFISAATDLLSKHTGSHLSTVCTAGNCVHGHFHASHLSIWMGVHEPFRCHVKSDIMDQS